MRYIARRFLRLLLYTAIILLYLDNGEVAADDTKSFYDWVGYGHKTQSHTTVSISREGQVKFETVFSHGDTRTSSINFAAVYIVQDKFGRCILWFSHKTTINSPTGYGPANEGRRGGHRSIDRRYYDSVAGIRKEFAGAQSTDQGEWGDVSDIAKEECDNNKASPGGTSASAYLSVITSYILDDY